MNKSPTRSLSQIGFHKINREKFSVMIKEDNVSPHSKNDDQSLGKERYPKVEIEINDNSQISLRDIVDSLKNVGYSFENKTISFFDPKRKFFIFCRKDENLLEYKISVEDIHDREVKLNKILMFFQKIYH